MAFEHDQFARFASSGPPPYRPPALLQHIVHHQKPPVLARPPRAKVSDMVPGDPGRRRALVVVGVKMVLLCGWLVHELIVGFDESRCLQLVKFSPAVVGPSGSNGTLGQSPLSAPNLNTLVTLGTKGQGNSNQTEDGEDAQRIGKTPKRRRKVILRRRLLRKGASAVRDGQNGIMRKGIVRRIVWRVVPLKRLKEHSNGEEHQKGGEAEEYRKGEAEEHRKGGGTEEYRKGEEAEEHRKGGEAEEHRMMVVDGDNFASGLAKIQSDKETGPVRTKTGTVVMLRREADGMERKTSRRRMAMRMVKLEADQNPKEPNADPDRPRTPHPQLFHVPLLDRPPSPASNGQVPSLLATALCLFRVFFDFWALLQCFCCALLLLGLHLRHRLLVLLPLLVDVLSATLAIVFGLSTVIFVLILLFLVRSLPLSSLWSFALFSASTNFTIALYTWATFCELNAFSELSKKNVNRKDEEMTRRTEEWINVSDN